MFANPTTPNQADYTLFLRNVVGIASSFLPDGAEIIITTLAIAQEIVNPQINCASARMYTLAVYNLAADRLINFAPDQPEQTYFDDLRGPEKLNISGFAPGVVASSSNETTASALLNPEQMKEFTLMDLQNLKTPYGREYISIAQSVGTLWGMS